MSGTVGVKFGPLALAALVTGLAACGTGAHQSRTSDPAAGRAQPGARDLDRFLMRKDEEPGFRPGALPGAFPRSRTTITGVSAFVADNHLTPADARRLRNEGFLSFRGGPIRGPQNTAGLTNVALYAAAQGAKHSMANDLRPAVIRAGGPIEGLRFFTVPGIPGARGWAASSPHVANVLWVQGRCYLTLGNQGPGPLTALLSKGAQAIHHRTNGTCP